MTRGQARTRRAVLGWWVLGLAAYALLPWYFQQDLGVLKALPGVFGGSDTASGLVQALRHGKPWLALGLLGLLLAGAGTFMAPSKRQGWLLLGGGALGVVGLLASGFAIGARGWSFDVLGAWFGSLANGQFGIGLGGVLVLLALLMLAGAGLARLGYRSVNWPSSTGCPGIT